MKKIAFLLAGCLLVSLTACRRDLPNAGGTTDRPVLSGVYNLPEEQFSIGSSFSCWPVNLQKAPGGGYLLPGGPVQIAVEANNKYNRADPYYLMILADGLPVEFSVEGEKYLHYPITLTPSGTAFTAELVPEFSVNLGRLDVFLLYDGDPLASTFTSVFTMHFAVEGKPLAPDTLQPTVARDVGGYGGSICDAWLRGPNGGAVQQRIITIRDGETVWFHGLSTETGLYRTVLVVNGAPVIFTLDGEEYAWLDWQSTGANMLRLPITLPHIPDNSRFYAIFTPIGESVVKRSIELSASSLINETLATAE